MPEPQDGTNLRYGAFVCLGVSQLDGVVVVVLSPAALGVRLVIVSTVVFVGCGLGVGTIGVSIIIGRDGHS